MRYVYPIIDLLEQSPDERVYDPDVLQQLGEKVGQVLDSWKTGGRVVDIRITPLTVCFEVLLDMSANAKNFKKMKEDFEVRLGSYVELIEPKGEKKTYTIVMLPKVRPTVSLRSVLDSEEFKDAGNPLTVAMGVTYDGEVMLANIEEMPHMLIAGTTGSGKTVFLDDLILSIIYRCSPDDVKMFMVDPKMVDLSFYNGIPHLLTPVIYESQQIFTVFGWAEDEMLNRYQLFEKSSVKNLRDYNDKNPNSTLPHILVIIDEYAELMKDYKKDIEDMIDRIGRMGRSAGIHLIVATQRPTADIVTSSIKSNLPCRVSFAMVDSKEASSILGGAGAQRLAGNGDMLFSMSSTSGTIHGQAPYVTEDEIRRVVTYVRKNNPVM